MEERNLDYLLVQNLWRNLKDRRLDIELLDAIASVRLHMSVTLFDEMMEFL